VSTRDVVERLRKAEEKKAMSDAKQAGIAAARRQSIKVIYYIVTFLEVTYSTHDNLLYLTRLT
jgi:hypothetical protein